MFGKYWFKLLAALVVLSGLLFAAGSPVAARMLAGGAFAPGGRLQARPVAGLESLISDRGVTDGAAAPSATITRGQDAGAQSNDLSVAPADGLEFEFTGEVTSLPPGPWVVGGRTLLTNAQTEIKPGVALGGRAKVHAIPQADGSLLAREIEPAEAADVPDDEFEITGTVTSVTDNVWTIGGQAVAVNSSTEIEAGLGLGSTVKAEGTVQADGTLLAREIKSLDADDAEDEDDDEGDNDGNSGDDNSDSGQGNDDDGDDGDGNDGDGDRSGEGGDDNGDSGESNTDGQGIEDGGDDDGNGDESGGGDGDD